MAELSQIVPAVLSGGVATWAGNAALHWLKSRTDRQRAQSETDVTLEKHRDQLTFDLLAAARSEVAAARAEVAELRPLESRLAHFDEALDHIYALLNADGPEEKKAAERRALAFLNRMRRIADARGTIINELQRAQSATAIPADMQASLDRLDRNDPV